MFYFKYSHISHWPNIHENTEPVLRLGDKLLSDKFNNPLEEKRKVKMKFKY